MAKNPTLPTGSAALNIEVNTNSYFDDIFYVKDERGRPKNFTGYTSIEMDVLTATSVVPPVISFTSTLNTLNFLTPLSLGAFQFHVSDTVMNTLPVTDYVYDLYITDSLGHKKKWFGGTFSIMDRGEV